MDVLYTQWNMVDQESFLKMLNINCHIAIKTQLFVIFFDMKFHKCFCSFFLLLVCMLKVNIEVDNFSIFLPQ